MGKSKKAKKAGENLTKAWRDAHSGGTSYSFGQTPMDLALERGKKRGMEKAARKRR